MMLIVCTVKISHLIIIYLTMTGRSNGINMTVLHPTTAQFRKWCKVNNELKRWLICLFFCIFFNSVKKLLFLISIWNDFLVKYTIHIILIQINFNISSVKLMQISYATFQCGKRYFNVLLVSADESYLRSETKAPKLGKTGCRKFPALF